MVLLQHVPNLFKKNLNSSIEYTRSYEKFVFVYPFLAPPPPPPLNSIKMNIHNCSNFLEDIKDILMANRLVVIVQRVFKLESMKSSNIRNLLLNFVL